MSKVKVCAVFMHEEEQAAIQAVTSNTEETESFIIGDMEESELIRLKEKGIPVRIIETKKKSPDFSDRFLSSNFPDDGDLESVPQGLSFDLDDLAIDVTKPNVFLIQLEGPLLENRRTELENLNIKLLELVSGYSYTAFLTLDQVNQVRSLNYVRSVELFTKQDTNAARSLERGMSGMDLSGSRQIKAFDIRLFREEDLQTVSEWLNKKNVLIAGENKTKIRFYTFEDSPVLDEMAALTEIASVEEYVQPTLFNDVARKLLNIDSVIDSGITQNITQQGAGQVIAVADTGIDDTHPDFNGRIIGKAALGRPGDTSDPIGHGTHVAGSILGDGTVSGGKLKGVAPEAKLYFQSILDRNGRLGGLPLNLQELFNDAYNKGARIHNNSWGSDTGSRYTFNAIEVDEFVAEKKDMLIVIAAGNNGVSADPPANSLVKKKRSSNHGFVDWLTIASPATAKNALTVGASRSDRKSGGFATHKYGTSWPTAFPKVTTGENEDISIQTVSGDPECIAGFSSRGPCDDRRIKPDLVAPGTDILSTKSSIASLQHFWGPYDEFDDKYAYMGGTSMATPLVAGCAALVRQYFIESEQHQPSAALIKATLINGTKRLGGRDAIAEQSFYHQGFGCVNMTRTIPNKAAPKLNIKFLDTYNDATLQFISTGQRFRFVVQLDGGTFFRVCMAYTDAPGRGLQNNLNLIIGFKDPETNQMSKWIGNDDVNNGLNIPDPDNNVERVWLEGNDFKPGAYTIMIFANNLLKTPQDFAMVVTSDAQIKLTRI